MIVKKVKYRLKTNSGFTAHVVVLLRDEGETDAIIITKTSFSDDKWEFTKREWKGVFYNEEILVLKFNTFLNISNLLVEFMEKK